MASAEESTDSPPENPSTYHRFEVDTEIHNDQRKDKEKWGFKIEFVLAAVGFSVVYICFWRFPYLMYRNGGVVFLFPYISCMLLFGVPMFYLETCLGQFWGKGPFHIWKFCPLFRGVGVTMIISNAISVLYTNMFLSLFLYYAGASVLSVVLPWTTCSNAWNTHTCGNRTEFGQSPADEYYQNRVLQLSSGIDDLGSMRWELVGCMVAISVLMFGALFWGVRLTGKILYVTLSLSLLMFLAIFIRGVTLPGARKGIILLLAPDVTKLNRFRLWVDAFVQATYTISISSGVVHTLASYNTFKAPCLRYSFTVCILTMIVSMVAAIMMMAIVGASAVSMGVPFELVVDQGPGLIFMAIPASLSTIPVAKFWCFIFFLMFLLLGLTKQFLMMEVFVRTITDIIPSPNHLKRLLIVAAICFAFLILTLPFLTQGGLYLVTLFDWYSWKFVFSGICILECITVTWIYGLDQFSEDIKMMTGLRPPIVYKFFWAIVIPIVFVSVHSYMEKDHTPVQYGSYKYPEYADRLGYFIAVLPLLAVPVFAIIRLVRRFRQSPLDPDSDCRPDTDRWPEYNAKQRRMERTVGGNLRAIFRS